MDLSDLIDLDLLIPSDEEINSIQDKLNKNEKLSFEDILTINKLKFINLIIKK